MASFTLLALYHREKNSWYLLDRRIGGPQNLSGRCAKEKNLAVL
jgi:hypothetical protein